MPDIFELRDAAATLSALERKMESLMVQTREAEKYLSKLLSQYESEKKDVENLQKSTLSAFILKLTGKYESRLSEETREEISAKQKYDAAAAEADMLNQEMKEIGRRIPVLRAQAAQFEEELERRRIELRERASKESEEFRRLDAERERLVTELTEINEALEAAVRADNTAQRAVISLEKAEDWATYDIWFDSGIIGHSVKYSHIDDAEACFTRLRAQMKGLRKELEDIRGTAVISVGEISSTQRMMDFWFDNIFTDLAVRDKIQGNKSEMRALSHKLGRIISDLRARVSHTEAEIECNRREQDKIIFGGL